MKKNYMKIKSDMDDALPLNKTIEIESFNQISEIDVMIY